jgi:hypothetical protein
VSNQLISGDRYLVDGLNRNIPPFGPPLPLLIEVPEGRDYKDLKPIYSVLNSAGGTKLDGMHQEFVLSVIPKLKDVVVWPQYSKVYGLLNSPTQRKYIAFDYSSVPSLPFYYKMIDVQLQVGCSPCCWG